MLGVEEELLLVDAVTGLARSSADSVMVLDKATTDVLTSELQLEQIETGTHPSANLEELSSEIVDLRFRAAELARLVGTRVAVLATSPLPVEPHITPRVRYQQMAERFGLTASEQLICGCHVHVSVADDEEGVAVLDRIRDWLPCLLALSANSPYWQGADTGYASYRSQAQNRWPSAGPTPVFSTPENYHSLVSRLITSGTVLDEGMVYFDARLSAKYPTVEIRSTDVCRRPQDTVLMAALVRGLVETASRDWRAGRAAIGTPTELLRMATWRAGRSGLTGELVHPRTGLPSSGAAVVAALVAHLEPVLSDQGERILVREWLDDLLSRGNGAIAQRETFVRTGDLRAVVLDAVIGDSVPHDTGR